MSDDLPLELPPRLPPRVPIVGKERALVGKALREWYEAGADAELLAIVTGRANSWVWTVLSEAGTPMRIRGTRCWTAAVRALEAHARTLAPEGPRRHDLPATPVTPDQHDNRKGT